MKIFVDEHIPLMTVRALRLINHDVRDIRGTQDEGRGMSSNRFIPLALTYDV